MKVTLRILALVLLPLAALAAERPLKIDKSATFIDVDVKATVNFSGRLDAFDAKVNVDDAGRIKSATFAFKFSDLKTGNTERDAAMLKWLGGGEPEGRFDMGNLALTPDGQGQVSGRLTFHGVTELVEFPINVTRADDTFTVTGEANIDYRNWNLKKIRRAMVFTVDPEVKIRFKLVGSPVEEAKK